MTMDPNRDPNYARFAPYDSCDRYENWYPASPQYEQPSPSYSYEYPHSSEMARYASSGGSSQASSGPDSPLSLRASHEFMMSDTIPQPGTYATSPAASMDQQLTPQGESAIPGRDWPVFCLMPDCNARPFRRTADLQRHYKNTHAPESQKDSFLCDYPRCTRSREPFHRRDHFRDHLREYHREDIQKRGNIVNEDWLEGRYLPTTWWRCPRCLVRVHISKHGFECPGCNTSCEPKRKERRRRGT